MERGIREAKRELAGAQILYEKNPIIENMSEVARAKLLLKNRQAAMRKFIAESNARCKPGTSVLTRQPRREWAGDMPKSATMTSMRHEEPLVKISKENNSLSISPRVNTKAYHDAFDDMPIPKSVSQSAYEQAGMILQKADGTQKEYLVAINARTGSVVADNTDIPAKDKKTGFTNAQSNAVNSCPDGVILIHNHPGSKPPSYRDIITATTEQNIRYSIVVGHNGDVWYFAANDPGIADELTRLYNTYKDTYGDYAEVRAVKTLLDSGKLEWRRA